MKPRIFIGSSSESYSIAEKIASLLTNVAKCVVWKNIFNLNQSNYENLANQIALYDYAILIATADDVTISRKKKIVATRDNVLFEFGLFAGALGRDRVFYIIEKNTKVPSDLFGVSLPEILKKDDAKHDESVLGVAGKIKKHIKNKEGNFDLN